MASQYRINDKVAFLVGGDRGGGHIIRFEDDYLIVESGSGVFEVSKPQCQPCDDMAARSTYQPVS